MLDKTDAAPHKSWATGQKELAQAYEQVSSDWLERVNSEAELWSGLAVKLTATRSIPEAMDAYHECLVKQMKMTVEDGQRLIVDYQKIVQILGRAWSSTWVTGKHVIGEW